MDVEPTVEIIKKMSQTMRQYADDLDRIADRVLETKDLTYSSEALNAISNCMGNLRIDLLATRPMRAFQRELNENS
jgi:hypothetical protein